MSLTSDTSPLAELETAVRHLTEQEYGEFRRWFLERDWEAWDQQIEADSASGKLDFLVREARDAKDSGKLRNP
jgi:hypothetical protein